MAWVYVLRGSNGRHYIGSAVDLDARFAQHLRGHTYTTKRLGGAIQIIASKQVATLREARGIERALLGSSNLPLANFNAECRLPTPKAFACSRLMSELRI